MQVIIFLIVVVTVSMLMLLWLFYDYKRAMEFIEWLQGKLNRFNKYLNSHLL